MQNKVVTIPHKNPFFVFIIPSLREENDKKKNTNLKNKTSGNLNAT